MYSTSHENEVALERAWQDYIDAVEDTSIPFSRAVALRLVYERLLDSLTGEPISST